MNEQEKIRLLEQINQYIQGELTQDEIEDLWKQFLQHPEWYDWFETELHLRSLINKGKKPNFNGGEAHRGSKSSAINLREYRVWIYAAAAAVLLAVGLQFFSFEQDEPIQNFALAEIEESKLIGADVLRSNDRSAEDMDVAINEALSTAYEGKTEEAIEEFQQLLTQSPNNQQQARIEMNLGILFYNSGEYESARTHFRSVTEIENIENYQKEKAWWFLGNTLLNLDQPRSAREAVFNAYSIDGQYQSPALSLLNKLDVRLGNIPTGESPEQLGE